MYDQRCHMYPVVRTAPAFGEGTVGVAMAGAFITEFQFFKILGIRYSVISNWFNFTEYPCAFCHEDFSISPISVAEVADVIVICT